MREGGIKQGKNGCIMIIGVFLLLNIFGFVLTLIQSYLWYSKGIKVDLMGWASYILGGFLVLWLVNRIILLPIRRRKGRKLQNKPQTPYSIALLTKDGNLWLNNPFRGIFVVGSAGSGKSESFAVPLLFEYIKRGFAGLVYDFKFPALGQEVETFKKMHNKDFKHVFLNFNSPTQSHQVNPIKPDYMPNSNYAREYANAIISNLLKESTKRQDYWSRSAADLLTACIWYLRCEHPHICDLPHVFALITSDDRELLETLQKNTQTAQMTISIYNAMKRGADSQVSGVVGTLQGAIAQINTPELMYIFSGDDFSLDLNNPNNPTLLTVGSYPTLANTFAPLCSLVITVATKLMNQPNKVPSFVMLDEAPTCYVPNLEVLPNTGRSNKISTVVMCQDLAQLVDGYGREKADVLFASCNNHFYGRVASSKTAEIMSRQFGKTDKVYATDSVNRNASSWYANRGQSETVQERDIYKPSVFLNLNVGEFAGITVESNKSTVLTKFARVGRETQPIPPPKSDYIDLVQPYNQARTDIKRILVKVEEPTSQHSGTSKKQDIERDFLL